ncbi:hypothetical protein RhiirA5_430901 [Rhizophagus irregularis]|uniref:Uncharacterized protein n=1 Tax=Rhizophagus irregularis TaxID=588596 RepID=A0A2N0NVY2_9GLOM|nr:hypothetical protein RhiirA5_430901 [Rhizophagus irregularis]
MSQSTNHAIDICELKLITIDPSLAGSSLDARSVVRDTTNDEPIILPISTSKANVPGTEAIPSPTPDEVNTSETEANALHVTPVMNKIAETSIKTPKTSQITRSVSKKTD